jgi:hypothetical protein
MNRALLPPKTERLWYRIYGRSRPMFWLPPGPERLLTKFIVKVRRDDAPDMDGVIWRRVGGRDRSRMLSYPYPMEVTRCTMDAPYEWRALKVKNEVNMDMSGVQTRWSPPYTLTVLTPLHNRMARLS